MGHARGWTLPSFEARCRAVGERGEHSRLDCERHWRGDFIGVRTTPCAVAVHWEGHPPAWPKYQTRKVWNDSQTPLRQNHACRLHDRDGHAPLGRRCAAEVWVMPEDGPSQVSRRAAAWFWLWGLNFSWRLGDVSKFKKCNFISNFSMDETPLATIFELCIRPLI